MIFSLTLPFMMSLFHQISFRGILNMRLLHERAHLQCLQIRDYFKLHSEKKQLHLVSKFANQAQRGKSVIERR